MLEKILILLSIIINQLCALQKKMAFPIMHILNIIGQTIIFSYYTGFYTDDAAGYAAALFIRGYWQVQDADIKICFSSDYSRANIVATKNEQVITFVLERKEYRDDEKAPDMLY